MVMHQKLSIQPVILIRAHRDHCDPRHLAAAAPAGSAVPPRRARRRSPRDSAPPLARAACPDRPSDAVAHHKLRRRLADIPRMVPAVAPSPAERQHQRQPSPFAHIAPTSYNTKSWKTTHPQPDDTPLLRSPSSSPPATRSRRPRRLPRLARLAVRARLRPRPQWELIVVDDDSTDATAASPEAAAAPTASSSFSRRRSTSPTAAASPARPTPAGPARSGPRRAGSSSPTPTPSTSPATSPALVHELEKYDAALLSYSPRQIVTGFWQRARHAADLL